jgi:hypothetical protein
MLRLSNLCLKQINFFPEIYTFKIDMNALVLEDPFLKIKYFSWKKFFLKHISFKMAVFQTQSEFWKHKVQLSESFSIYQKLFQGPSEPWSYGSRIYNYLCNQCLSPLMFESRSGRGVQHYAIKFASSVSNTNLTV